jgi:hypothetical protein
MPCALTSGITRYNCESPAGGISEVYLLAFEELTSITVTACEVTAITTSGAPSTWYRYELNEEVGLLETTETKSVQNNSLFYDANLSFTVTKMEASKCNELNLLAIQRIVAIIKTVEGKFFLLGDERGAHKTGGTNNSSTGTAYGDLNGYSINLMAKQTHDVYEVDAAVIAGLTIAV